MEERQGVQEKNVNQQDIDFMWLVDIQEQDQNNLEFITKRIRCVSLRRS